MENEKRVTHQACVLETEFNIHSGNLKQPLSLYDSLKVKPIYKKKPVGIDMFIETYEDTRK